MKRQTIGSIYRGLGWAVVASLAVSVGTPALAAEGDHPRALLQLLKLIDQSPTRAQLVEAGAGEDGAGLIRVMMDREVLRFARIRAAGALGAFPGEASERALSAVAEDAKYDDAEIRVQAIGALAWVEGVRSVPRLSRLLDDREPEIRAAAVRALARTPHPDAKRAIERRVDRESVPWIRAMMAERIGR